MHTSYFFAIGIFCVAYWPALPGLPATAVLMVFGMVPYRRANPFAWLMLGMCYGIFWGYQTLAHQLPESLTPSDHLVTGVVEGIPVQDGHRLRFNLKIVDSPSFPNLQRLRLSWYQYTGELSPGQVWQLQVRLRRPRGTVNPGGFDYQAWLLREGISATGYVRDSNNNRLLDEQLNIDAWRYRLREQIVGESLSDNGRALIAALTLGDRSLISKPVWEKMSQYGLVHLLVVSGLHIGLLSAVGFWLGTFLSRVVALLGVGVNTRYAGALAALLFAAGYSVLAGLSLPTQRALVMIVVALCALLANRHISRGTGFGLALAAVALIDPLATTSAGFWLSFGAVAGLLWLLPHQHNTQRWLGLLQVQWLVFVVLWLPLVFWQLPVAWLSPLVNLLAIPWVGFIVVPLCLLGAAMLPISQELALSLWSLAGWQLDRLLFFLEQLELPSWLPQYPTWGLSGSSLWLMLVVAALVILPKGVPGRWLSLPVLSALLLSPSVNDYPLALTVLDVGQGLSVVVRTERHNLVYDAGPSYGRYFSTGSAIVAPFLRHEGVDELHRLVISHADNDHAGGAEGLSGLFPPTEVFSGEPKPGGKSHEQPCLAGVSWQWDGIGFKFLHPPPDSKGSGNNRSCVLLISYGSDRILLSGDIEANVERQLLRTDSELQGPIDILLAPHHGSRTSSSREWVSVLRPAHVVFSAGFRHHFGHPSGEVVRRYRAVGSKLWNTAEAGAVQFNWLSPGEIQVTTERKRNQRYWY